MAPVTLRGLFIVQRPLPLLEYFISAPPPSITIPEPLAVAASADPLASVIVLSTMSVSVALTVSTVPVTLRSPVIVRSPPTVISSGSPTVTVVPLVPTSTSLLVP